MSCLTHMDKDQLLQGRSLPELQLCLWKKQVTQRLGTPAPGSHGGSEDGTPLVVCAAWSRVEDSPPIRGNSATLLLSLLTDFLPQKSYLAPCPKQTFLRTPKLSRASMVPSQSNILPSHISSAKPA